MPFRFSPSRAFTLIELIATIAVLAAITTAGLFFVGSYVQSAKQTADKQTLFVLNDALNRYKTQGGGVSGLTSGAPIKNVLARLQLPVNWNGLTHQFLQNGKTYAGRSIDCKGTGNQYRFTRYNTHTEEAGGLSPVDLGPGSGNLVGWWRFDEGSGTSATDSSGNGNNGNLVGGATYVTGQFGNALQFDGVDDYVSLPDTNLSFLSPYTISVWFNPNDLSNNGAIFGKEYYEYQFDLQGSLLRWTQYNTTGSGVIGLARTITSANTWYHAVATFDGTTAILYVNGSAVTTDNAFYGTARDIANQTRIGTGYSHNLAQQLYYFHGLIDDVRIYNRALTTSEVQQLYNNP
jgi:prepilin-type N-terminal cleavage/methylation domain-containing protein